MRVAYKRGSEIFAEYWLEIIRGDLIFKTELVTLCTIRDQRKTVHIFHTFLCAV
jgi:hypothetical protein